MVSGPYRVKLDRATANQAARFLFLNNNNSNSNSNSNNKVIVLI